MPTPITGDPTAVSNSLQRTIDGATNATPIVISTTVSHLFATGDTVLIRSVAGNTAANGQWVITVLTATTFSLTGSVGSGAYTSGGTATDISLTPAFNIPSGGDLRNAASVDVALEALADRTQFLATNQPVWSAPLANLSALQSINTTNMPTGTSRVVTGQGLYIFNSASVAQEYEPWIVRPSVGTGRWIPATTHDTDVTRVVSGLDVRWIGYPAQGLVGTDITTFATGATNTVAFGADIGGTAATTIAYVDGGKAVVPAFSLTPNNVCPLLWVLDPYLIDGAAIIKIDVHMKRSAAGAIPPGFGVKRISHTGAGNATSLKSTAFGFATGSGTGDITWAWTPDQNNTVDKTAYSYILVAYGDSGASAATDSWLSFDVSMSVPDARRS